MANESSDVVLNEADINVLTAQSCNNIDCFCVIKC